MLVKGRHISGQLVGDERKSIVMLKQIERALLKRHEAFNLGARGLEKDKENGETHHQRIEGGRDAVENCDDPRNEIADQGHWCSVLY